MSDPFRVAYNLPVAPGLIGSLGEMFFCRISPMYFSLGQAVTVSY